MQLLPPPGLLAPQLVLLVLALPAHLPAMVLLLALPMVLLRPVLLQPAPLCLPPPLLPA